MVPVDSERSFSLVHTRSDLCVSGGVFSRRSRCILSVLLASPVKKKDPVKKKIFRPSESFRQVLVVLSYSDWYHLTPGLMSSSSYEMAWISDVMSLDGLLVSPNHFCLKNV